MKALFFSWLITWLAFCIDSVQADSSPSKIDLGLIVPVSGNWQAAGDAIVKGCQLAIAELQGTSSLYFTLKVEDSREETGGLQAVTAFRRLRSAGVTIFIGPVGVPAARALAPLVVSDPSVIMITPSVGLEDFHQSSNRIFNARGTDEEAVRQLAQYGWVSGWKKAAVISTQQPWEEVLGKTFAQAFTDLGGSIVASLNPLPDTRDFSSLITRVVNAHPDGVFMSNYNTIRTASKQLRAAKYSGPILSINIDASRLEGAANSLEGARFTLLAGATPVFAEKYRQKFGGEPPVLADTAYDSVMALALALRQAPPNASALSEALQAISWDASGRELSFGTARRVQRSIELWEVVNGTFRRVKSPLFP